MDDLTSMKPPAATEQMDSYLFLHGISVPRTVRLDPFVELRPAPGIPSSDFALEIATSPEEAAALLLFLPRIASELRVCANTEEQLAVRIWNANWDALLLGAILACEVGHSIESQHSAADVTNRSVLRVTNYHLHGWRSAPREASESDCCWLEQHFTTAKTLLLNESFQNSVHCLASYCWHPHPRARLALIWAGIEGIFGIENELSFRLSLCAAKFLEPIDRARASSLFKKIKKLYSTRSKAVHGGTIRGNGSELVQESASLLHMLVKRVVETGGLPKAEDLLL